MDHSEKFLYKIGIFSYKLFNSQFTFEFHRQIFCGTDKKLNLLIRSGGQCSECVTPVRS